MQNFPKHKEILWDKIISLLSTARPVQDTLNSYKDLMSYVVHEVMMEQLYSESNNYVPDYGPKESDWSSICYEFFWYERQRLLKGELKTSMNAYFYYREKAYDLKTLCREYLDNCGLKRNKKTAGNYTELELDELNLESQSPAMISQDFSWEETNKEIKIKDLIKIAHDLCEKEIFSNSKLSPGRKHILKYCILERNSPLEIFKKHPMGYEACRKMVLNFKKKVQGKLDERLEKSIKDDRTRASFIRWFLMLRKSPKKKP